MSKDPRDVNLADIISGNPVNKKVERIKPSYVQDELDEPKYKIVNPELFAKSRQVLGNIISKRMKTSGGTDIDWLIEHKAGFIIFELKIFYDDRIIISKAQMSAYERLYENLPKCYMLFIGHDDIDFKKLDDPVWLFEMSDWKSDKIPHVEGTLTDPMYSDKAINGYTVERGFMDEIDVKQLRDKIDASWKEFE